MSNTELLLILIIISILSVFLYNHIFEYYYNKDPKIIELKEKISVVFPDIMKIKIFKSEGKSYTINKRKVYLCLKDEKGNYYNNNMLIYVLLHEYSHILCDEIGHTEKFHKIFDEVILKASNEKLYNPSLSLTENYCEYKE